MTLSSIYNFNISIFVTVYLIGSLGKIDYLIYQEEKHLQEMFLKLFPGHQNLSKILNLNKN